MKNFNVTLKIVLLIILSLLFLIVASLFYLSHIGCSFHLLKKAHLVDTTELFEQINNNKSRGFISTDDFKKFCYIQDAKQNMKKTDFDQFYEYEYVTWFRMLFGKWTCLLKDMRKLELLSAQHYRPDIYIDRHGNVFVFNRLFSLSLHYTTAEILDKTTLAKDREMIEAYKHNNKIYLKEIWKYTTKKSRCIHNRFLGPPLKRNDLFSCDRRAETIVLFCKYDAKEKHARCGCDFRILFADAGYPVDIAKPSY
jgi:hypothetical protein